VTREFQGKIDVDVGDSVPDWEAFLPSKAPAGAPNVLVVLYDDTGCASWSPYGGRINMPTMERLAANWAYLFAMAHDRPVFADPFDVSHRTQSSPERLRHYF